MEVKWPVKVAATACEEDSRAGCEGPRQRKHGRRKLSQRVTKRLAEDHTHQLMLPGTLLRAGQGTLDRRSQNLPKVIHSTGNPPGQRPSDFPPQVPLHGAGTGGPATALTSYCH
ncbi:hypothetical protein CapIbe_022640 [Capra ibex]